MGLGGGYFHRGIRDSREMGKWRQQYNIWTQDGPKGQEADKLKIERFRYWAKFPEKLRKLTGLMEENKNNFFSPRLSQENILKVRNGCRAKDETQGRGIICSIINDE